MTAKLEKFVFLVWWLPGHFSRVNITVCDASLRVCAFCWLTPFFDVVLPIRYIPYVCVLPLLFIPPSGLVMCAVFFVVC